MCLVSVCPKGTEKNTKEVEDFIRSGYNSNRSGSGFMYKRNGSTLVNVQKGYFDIEKLLKDLKELNLGVNDELAIHHRIPTSGDRNDLNTHPFVISNIHEEVCAVKIAINKPAMVHNGVFSVNKYEYLNRNMSDTYAFARYIMGNKHIMNLLLDNQELFEYSLSSVISHGRVAILFPDRDLVMFGSFVEDNGYFHSNGGYKTYTRNVGGVEKKDDDDFEDDTVFVCGFPMTIRKKKDHNSNFLNEGSAFREEHAKFIPAPRNEAKSTIPKIDIVERQLTIVKKEEEYKSLTKLVTLDNTFINIDFSNYKHFRYIRKTNWDARKIDDKTTLFCIKDFDANVEFQTIFYGTDGIESAINVETILTKVLIDDCYYIPKGNYYYDIYTDYKKLVNLSIKPTKTGVKTLEKKLSACYKKSAVDKIPYSKVTNGRVEKKFCKKALELHLADLRTVLEVDSPENPFKEVVKMFP